VPNHTILFTDETWASLAHRPMQKIVLVRPGRMINDFSAITELTSMNPQGVNLGSNPDIFGSSGNPSPLAFQLVIKKPLPSCSLKERGDKNCFSFELLH